MARTLPQLLIAATPHVRTSFTTSGRLVTSDTSKLAALLVDAVAAQLDKGFLRRPRVRRKGGRLYGLPTRYGPNKRPDVGIIADEWEMLAQFDDAGQFATVFLGPTDCLGGDVIDSEHQINSRIPARPPTLPLFGRGA